MPEFGHVKKRKSRESWDDDGSDDSDWVSTSSSAPKAKKRRGTRIIGVEVGDSNHIQLLGREILGRTMNSAIQKEKPHPNRWVIDSLNADENCVNDLELNKKANGQTPGLGSLKPTLPSLSNVRNCMETLIEELREARTRMLQWMRQEMRILYETSATPCVRTSSAGQVRGDLEEQEPQTNGMPPGNGSVCLVERQFREQDAQGSTGQDGEGVSRAGLGSSENKHAAGSSRYDNHTSGNVQEGMSNSERDGGTNQRMGLVRASQGSASGEARFGACDGGSSHSEQVLFAFVDCRGDALAGFERQNEGEGRMDSSMQTDIVTNKGQHGFHVQSEICGGIGFGVEPGTSGGLGYGGCSNGSLINFGGHCNGKAIDEFRGSLGLGNASSPNTTGIGNHQEMSLGASKEEGTPDFMGLLQSQADAVELQNSVAWNAVWNMMQQGERSFNHGGADSGLPHFSYDASVKFRSGEPANGALIGNGVKFDNSNGLMRSATLQNMTSVLGRQLPVPMRSINHTLNSVGMPTLVTLQNQVPMQSPSTLQNFLGLNVGVNSVFPGMYYQENGQQCLSSSKGAGVAISPHVGLTHKRGSGLLSLDMLELNT